MDFNLEGLEDIDCFDAFEDFLSEQNNRTMSPTSNGTSNDKTNCESKANEQSDNKNQGFNSGNSFSSFLNLNGNNNNIMNNVNNMQMNLKLLQQQQQFMMNGGSPLTNNASMLMNNSTQQHRDSLRSSLHLPDKQNSTRRLSSTSMASIASTSSTSKASFPSLLHEVLTQSDQAPNSEISSIISWSPHGRSFFIHDTTKFVTTIFPKYFKTLSKFSSFQRQLTSYGFKKIDNKNNSRDHGAYYHEHFLRGRPNSVMKMVRLSKNTDSGSNNSKSGVYLQFYSLPFIGSDGQELTGSNNGTSNNSGDFNNNAPAVVPSLPVVPALPMITNSNNKSKTEMVLENNNKNNKLENTKSCDHGVMAKVKEINEKKTKFGLLPYNEKHPLDQVPFFVPLDLLLS